MTVGFRRIVIILTMAAACTAICTGDAVAQTSHLADGIAHYNAGRYDEALNEFRAELEIDEHCPLAYYYAAKIRIERNQYSRAVENLEAALRDSAGFHDANGLMAFALNKSGFTPEALVAWQKFTNAVGTLEGGGELAAESIVQPEKYHELLRLEADRIQRERETAAREKRERLAAEQARRDSIAAAEQVQAETSGDSTAAPLPAAQETAAEDIEIPIEDMSERIDSAIRTIFYVFGIGLVVAAAGIFTAVRIIRKRRSASEEKVFSEEVERIISDREFESSEEQAISEFEVKKRELLEIVQPRIEHLSEKPADAVEPIYYLTPVDTDPAPHPEPAPAPEHVHQTKITEEIKALVSKMYREGKSPEQIAQVADLSKTEVELILAVRERRMDNLIKEFHDEDSELIDSDQLVAAVQNLSFEGASTRDIAKQLNISISEVVLAYSIIEKKAENSGLS